MNKNNYLLLIFSQYTRFYIITEFLVLFQKLLLLFSIKNFYKVLYVAALSNKFVNYFFKVGSESPLYVFIDHALKTHYLC